MGVTFDSALSWDHHYKEIRKKILFRIIILKRVKDFLPPKSRLTYYNSFIKPYFDYCSEIWGESSKSYIYKLYLLQKRIISNASYLSHTAPLFLNLKILPLPLYFQFCKSLFFYKLTHNMYPKYLSQLIPESNNLLLNLRSNTIGNLPVRHTRTSLALNSPINSGIRLWNSLPANVKTSQSLAIFKRRCFNHYFEQIE